MAEKRSPELRTFQKSYDILLHLRYSITSICTKAFSAELVSQDVRDRCSNESTVDTERTKYLLNALEDRMKCVPSTLQDFVEILQDIPSLKYISEQLDATLDEEMKLHTRAEMLKQRLLAGGVYTNK